MIITKRLAIAWLAVCYLATGGAWTLAGSDQTSPSYRTYVDGPWGQIHVRVDGPASIDAPTVVLVHKMVWSSAEFERVQPLLARSGVRSIAIDLPGYGLSDGPSYAPGAAEYADSLLPVLDHFGLSKVNLLGYHTGATIVAAFADAHPERVKSLILEGPPVYDAEERATKLARKRFDQTPQPDGSHLSEKWQQIHDRVGASTSLASQQLSLMEFFTAGPLEWYAHDAAFSYDLGPAIQRLTVPVLLLISAGDSLYDTALTVQAMRPEFSFIELPWKGAHAMYDDPVAWAEAVAAYVKANP